MTDSPIGVELDPRPINCRFRLQEEGKPYPQSECNACHRTIMTGLGRKCAHIGDKP